uniref:Uncharacterized protein LOC111104719 n=1 Tax=Crassostrea virginica TaxID=6565 RepID=A0A8B8ATV1_CRAVI|nr:uncharacterized protein LOC111104719 [Crassostrea virginica]XP_022294521.1 uncharacterized protein LOC111104719 [Crassostrea virginica]
MKRQLRRLLFIILIFAFSGFAFNAVFQRYRYNETPQLKKTPAQELEIKNEDIWNFLMRPQGKLTNVENKDKRYAQVKQDEVVYDILLQKKTGFFVDIGAHDGQFLSNTLWLERQHNWTGLLIEANPELCEKIDKLKRHVWRLCACLSKSQNNVTFIKGNAVGGILDHIDHHHIKMLDPKNKVVVPCFNMEQVLNEIGAHHIDFYSLDVEGAEMAILETLRNGLREGAFTVDVWSIEYRVWDGHQIIFEKSMENLNALRKYFNELGGYFEYSALPEDVKEGYALDVVYVRVKTWCETRSRFPNGTNCSLRNLKNYLLQPHPYKSEQENPDKRYSQAKQDEVAYNITNKKSGFFVDIGAHDGQLFSNTLWLERKHIWTGLLIEANPDLCQKIDALNRHAWRMCACLSDTMQTASFIKGDTVGGIENHIDEHHIKLLDKKNTITVPCFSMEAALDVINRYHIDFFSLDVEGAEMAILNTLKKGLLSKRFTVDVWTIEYRVWDGNQVVFNSSLANLKALRNFFQEVGGYTEFSQLSNDENFQDGYALDVVFVRNSMYCKKNHMWPNGHRCK